MSKKASFWIFLIGPESSALLSLGIITWETHRQVETLSQMPPDYRQCIA